MRERERECVEEDEETYDFNSFFLSWRIRRRDNENEIIRKPLEDWKEKEKNSNLMEWLNSFVAIHREFFSEILRFSLGSLNNPDFTSIRRDRSTQHLSWCFSGDISFINQSAARLLLQTHWWTHLAWFFVHGGWLLVGYSARRPTVWS